jgi:helicase MOV-10
VVHYVKLLVTQTRPPVAPKDIGIITPYNRQAQKIRAALKASGFLSSPEDIKVGSVETFQGQERRVIILSTVRAENELVESEDKKYNLGFVANEKRFNVAMTRAKALLIVIGHPMVLATDEKNWLPLLRLCKEKGAWLGEEWNELDEDDEEEMLSLVAAREGDILDENSSEEDWVDVDEDDGPFSQQVEQGDVVFVNREE